MSANERTTQTPGATPEPSRGLNTDVGTTPSNGVRLAELEAFKARSSVFGASPEALDVLRLAMEEWRAKSYATQARVAELEALQNVAEAAAIIDGYSLRAVEANARAEAAEREHAKADWEREERVKAAESELEEWRVKAYAAQEDAKLWKDIYNKAALAAESESDALRAELERLRGAVDLPDAYYADLVTRLKGKDGP